MALRRGRPPHTIKPGNRKDIDGNPIAVSRYPKQVRDEVFEVWYKLDRPPIDSLRKYIRDKLKIGRVSDPSFQFCGLSRAPVNATLKAWMDHDKWEKQANERDARIRDALTFEAIAAKKHMIKSLVGSSQNLMDAQATILKQAQLETLTPTEARALLPLSLDLAKAAIIQLRDALDLLPEADNASQIGRPDLNTVISAFEQLLGGKAGELRAALAVKVGDDSPKDIPKLEDPDIVDAEWSESLENVE